jgi:hypothetical protein
LSDLSFIEGIKKERVRRTFGKEVEMWIDKKKGSGKQKEEKNKEEKYQV